MVNYVIIDEIDSREYNVILSEVNTYGVPQKRYNTYEVPGRNGDVVIDTGTYLNIDIKYGCICKKKSDAIAFISEIVKKSGYCKIKDSLDTNNFRVGVMKYAIDPTVYKNEHYIFSIVFNCKPQKYTRIGDTEYKLEGSSILNVTSNPCMPIFRLIGNGELSVGENK